MITDRTTEGPTATDRGHRRATRRRPWLWVPFLTRLALGDLRRRPLPTVVAAVAGAIGGGLLARPVGGASAWVAIALLTSAAAALASATDPTEREQARLLVEQGCPRTVLCLARWLSAAAPPAAAGTVAAILGGLAPGTAEAHADTGVALVLLTTAAGAWSTAGSVLPGQRRTPAQQRVESGARVAVGALLATLAILLVTTTSSGSDLDLALPVSLAIIFGAFALVAPAAVAIVAGVIERMPSSTARLGASSTSRNRRGLTLPVTLIAALTCLLVVMVVVGEGLGAREAARRQALSALGPATVAGSDRLIIVQRSFMNADPATVDPTTIDLVTRIRAAVPDAEAADVVSVALKPRSGRAVFGEVRSTSILSQHFSASVDVAVASPELLEVLGLHPDFALGRRAVVLDARVLRADNTVQLVAPEVSTSSPDPGADRPITLPAVLARPGSLPVGLPAVLLPRSALPPLVSPEQAGASVVVRFDRAPSSTQLAAIGQTVPATTIRRGDQPVDVFGSNRTDRVDSIVVRDRSDSYRLLGELLAVAVAAGALAHLAIRLATRREDVVLLDLGAARSTLVRVVAVRAAVVAVVGVGLGAAVGLGGVAAGLASYRRHGRFADVDPLAPIPFTVPAPVWFGLVGLAAVVVLAGVVITVLRPSRPSAPGPPLRALLDE